MKSIIAVFAGILLLAGQTFGAEDTALQSQKDKVSYIIGIYSGKNLKKQLIDIDLAIMAQGLKDSLSGGKMLLTDQEMKEVMAVFQKEQKARQPEIRKALAEKNQKEGEAFLAENQKKEGVKTLASGLQYKVIQEGTGKNPKLRDVIVVHYRGARIDGTEFESSYRQGPATFKLEREQQTIKGGLEALLMMKEGAKWQIFIPSDLAYGENGAGAIEPNATLIYDVELITIYSGLVTPPQTTKPGEKSSKAAEKSSKPAAKPSKPAAGK